MRPKRPPGLTRGRPRAYLEWKTLKRWGRLPERERLVPGFLLRVAREEAGMTQKQLALMLGVSQQAIAQAERWDSNPTISFMRRWAEATGARMKITFSAA